MIFKTINSSVDETRKTLALFNKDWNTYKRNWQNTNGVFGKIGSVFTPANAITKSDIEAIKAYNSQIDSCVTSQTAFNRTMLNASPAAQNLVASYNGGKVSAQGMATAQNAAKASTIGLTIAQTALNAAIGMGIGLLISLVVKGIDKLVHANEEAIEKAEELRKKYEEFKSTNESNVTTLNGLKKEFEELSKGVSQYGDNISLTTEQYERYKEIIQQIVGMSPSLAEGYSTENGYIADKNGLLERAIELQEIEYRNELRKITNLQNLKTSMAGYIAEYKDAFEGGWATEDMSATSTVKATDFSNALYKAFNYSERYNDGYSSEDLAREILKSLGIDNIDKEMEKFFNENGYYQPNWFFEEYVDEIAKNIDAITNALSYENVGLEEDEFENRILTVKDCAQAYLDMKDSISMANESIQRDLQYIAEYADGYSNLTTEQQKFVNEFLKGFNIDDIVSRDWFGNLTYDEDKMKSVKRQITDFVEALSQDETTKSALADLYAIPTDEQSISEFIEQFRNALEVIKAYCQENGIEIPIAITDSEQTINDLEAQYQRAVDFAKDKFDGYDPTAFFKEHSINTQEEIDKWQEIAQGARDAAEAEKEYIQSSTLNENPILSIDEAKKAVNGFKEGDTEVIGLIDELSLLQEVLSDTGNIQEETYEKLISCSAKYSTAIRTENGRITLNTTKLKQVAKARQIDTKETIKETLALKKQEWIQWKNKIDNFNGSLLESIEEKYDDIDVLQKEITQYELLVNSLDNATSAFERFKAAQQTNDQDMYDTAKDAFDVLKEYSSDIESDNFGKYNRDEFQEAVLLFMDNDTYRKALNAKDLEEYQNVVDGFVKSIAPLFDENNAKSASNLFDEVDKIIKSGDVPKADIDWAERLGVSKEVFNALKQLANLYDYNNKEVFESYQLNTLDNYQEKLSNVKAAQDALNECTDKTSNEYLKLSKELDTAKRKLSDFEKETTSEVTDAWEKYDNLFKGHDEDIYYNGKSFTDYLKDTLDFDENDITGVIDVALDQIDKLQDTMSHMDPKSKAYQEFSDRVSQLKDIVTECGYSFEDANAKKDAFESSQDKNNTKNLEAYKKLSQQAEQYTQTLAHADIGSEAYQSALEGLQMVQSAMEGLKEPVRIEIQTNIDEIDSKISAVESRIGGLKQTLANTTNASAQSAIQAEINSAQNQKTSLEGQKAELEQTLKIVLDSSEVDGYDPGEKEMPVTAILNSSVVDGYTPPKKTMDVTVKLNTSAVDNFHPSVSGNSSGGTGHADGTVGNAFASGYNGLPSKEKGALRSEYGQKELTVYPNGIYEVTDKPTISDLPKGTVIFNEEQTERILKGNAHVDGTVGKAFNDGMGTRVNLINFKDVTTNNKAIVNAKNATKEVADAVEEAAGDAKEASEEVFDWIERRIKKFQRLFDKWLKQAETAITNTFITKYYKKATSNLNKLLSTQSKAFNRYMQEANNVGLDEAYAKKVRNGTIDIETITDEDLADKIQKYQEWYITCHVA